MRESRWMMVWKASNSSVHPENVAKMFALFTEQPYPTFRAIAEELNVGKEAVRTMSIQK